MIKRLFVLSIIFFAATVYAQTGEELYKTNCAACHTIGGGRLVGPDLKGVSSKRSNQWLIQFIKSSQSLVKSGDADAVAIFNEYNKMIMPDQSFSESDMNQIIAYLETRSAAMSSQDAEKDAAAAFTATDADIQKGLALFQGYERFSNKGPSCIACHHIKNDAIYGGNFAKELTDSFSNLGVTGLSAIIKSPPFPAMKNAYLNAPLSDEESHALIAFMQHAEGDQFNHDRRDFKFRFIYTAAAGVALLFGLYAIMGIRRKRNLVNQKIFDRQDRS